MKTLIILGLGVIAIAFGMGWLAGTSYAYQADNPEQDLSRCKEIAYDLHMTRDQVRLSDGRWCSL